MRQKRLGTIEDFKCIVEVTLVELRCDSFNELVALGKVQGGTGCASTRRTVRTEAARDLGEYTGASLKKLASIVSNELKVSIGNRLKTC